MEKHAKMKKTTIKHQFTKQKHISIYGKWTYNRKHEMQ